ncbi:hypothetical protein EJ04DRAFT_294962 [Polyplosphaeria fusca]|uniref:Uncharacterized protein n=1 Tax=Polyplosphaeria fusca TaxID=682080 RepID=A0A9P4V4Q6_9PLEO|nr:hypothetical protein EJ04DRAFT_294962 [Polyplosphaeria fusca]
MACMSWSRSRPSRTIQDVELPNSLLVIAEAFEECFSGRFCGYWLIRSCRKLRGGQTIDWRVFLLAACRPSGREHRSGDFDVAHNQGLSPPTTRMCRRPAASEHGADKAQKRKPHELPCNARQRAREFA